MQNRKLSKFFTSVFRINSADKRKREFTFEKNICKKLRSTENFLKGTPTIANIFFRLVRDLNPPTPVSQTSLPVWEIRVNH